MVGIPFSKLDKNIQIQRCVVPHFASVTKNPDEETTEQVITMQEKFIRLSPNIRKKMGEEISAPVIIKIGKDFQLQLPQLASISRAIRSYFFGEINMGDIAVILSGELGIDIEKAKKIGKIITFEIIDKNYSDQAMVQIPLLVALSKYENLGNQLITGERIKIKSQGESVRPSLLYWLKCYRDELGIGQHNSIERGDFLFRSENCKKLSPEERERVSLILKSIEENLPLTIDTDRQEIIFPVFQGVVASTHLPEIPRVTIQSGISTQNIASARSSYTSNVSGANKPVGVSHSDGPAHIPVPINLPEEKSEVFVNGGLHINPSIVSRPLERKIAENGSISFSAGHIFPAEKEVIEKRTGMIQEESHPQKLIPVVSPPSFTPAFHPAPKTEVSDDSNPFIIHPSSKRRQET